MKSTEENWYFEPLYSMIYQKKLNSRIVHHNKIKQEFHEN